MFAHHQLYALCVDIVSQSFICNTLVDIIETFLLFAMASFTADDLKQEMVDVQKMIESRGFDPDYSSALDICILQGLMTKVSNLQSLSTVDATDLFKLLNDLQMPDAIKPMLKEAIENKLAGTTLCIATLAKPQYLEDINNYLTQAEWTVLESKSHSYQSKVQVVVDRLISLQVVSLHEQTVKHCIALLLAVHFGQDWPSYQSIYTMVQDFKKCFGACTKSGPTRMVRYPSLPSMLPQDIRNKAYQNPEQQPIAREVERMKMIANLHVPLRNTSSLLKKNIDVNTSASSGSQAQQFQHVPHNNASSTQMPNMFASNFGFGQGQPADVMQFFQRMCMPQMFSAHPGSYGWPMANNLITPPVPSTTWSSNDDGSKSISANASTPAGAARLAIEYSPRKKGLATSSSDSLALRAPELLVEESTEDSKKAADGSKTSAEYEDAAFQALLAKKEKDAKKKKKGTVKEKVQPMKRPAAAAASSSSEPSKRIKFDEYSVSSEDAATMTVHSFTSKHYHAATQCAKRSGLDDYDAKIKGRVAYKEAKLLWMQHHNK